MGPSETRAALLSRMTRRGGARPLPHGAPSCVWVRWQGLPPATSLHSSAEENFDRYMFSTETCPYLIKAPNTTPPIALPTVAQMRKDP